jgi:hypothetical protein
MLDLEPAGQDILDPVHHLILARNPCSDLLQSSPPWLPSPRLGWGVPFAGSERLTRMLGLV